MLKHIVDFYEAFSITPDGVGITNYKTSLAKFINESDARTLAKGQGAYGKDGEVVKGTVTILVYETLTEYQVEVQSKLRERALSKLTAEEQAILGL